MFKLSSAYGARWRSAFGNRELRYNERLWHPIAESNSPDELLFGLIDKTDGSAFIICVETIDEPDSVTNEDLCDHLFEPFSEDRFQLAEYSDIETHIAGLEFAGFAIKIANPKFGDQHLQVLFVRDQNQVTVLQISWPSDMSTDPSELPVKHLALLQGLSL